MRSIKGLEQGRKDREIRRRDSYNVCCKLNYIRNPSKLFVRMCWCRRAKFEIRTKSKKSRKLLKNFFQIKNFIEIFTYFEDLVRSSKNSKFSKIFHIRNMLFWCCMAHNSLGTKKDIQETMKGDFEATCIIHPLRAS